MNGPQHYARAEELLLLTKSADGLPVESVKVMVAKAQVHATLAQVAALFDTSVDHLNAWPHNKDEWHAKTAAQTGELL
ncbi:hypothetical protein E3_0630 [Rhodococcus phage E3]|uniref:hypothetical protein n=1 Tax=Rhodococcus phage E3 TaxID=1007869 RepID=UPI0002C69697|nr:hypothetical protein M176_gp067 [Rhodococcus phage E3]AEQ20977.1 hypothetical protein E3_0630 [Rhodococcus phage E3]